MGKPSAPSWKSLSALCTLSVSSCVVKSLALAFTRGFKILYQGFELMCKTKIAYHHATLDMFFAICVSLRGSGLDHMQSLCWGHPCLRLPSAWLDRSESTRVTEERNWKREESQRVKTLVIEEKSKRRVLAVKRETRDVTYCHDGISVTPC